MAEKTKKFYIYSLPPIDWWHGFQAVGDYIEHMKSELNAFGDTFNTTRFISDLMELAPLFARAGWEGDIREGVYLAGLPTDEPDTELIFALKQKNNGSTFIASPYRLPWIKEHEVK